MKNNGGGFTILETMIVLMISSAMLFLTIALFSGRQRSTQFSQSMRDIESKLQDVLNDVSTGYFPSSTNVSCSAGSTGEPSIGNSNSEQGASYECLFMGKAIWLQKDGFYTYPVVGNRNLATNATQSSTLASVSPIVVPELQEFKPFLWNTRMYSIMWNNANDMSGNGAMIAVVSSINGTGNSPVNGSYNSGLQKINLYSSGTVSGTGVDLANTNQTNAESAITTALQNPSLSWVPGDLFVMCFQDDSAGSSGRQYGGVVVSGGIKGIEARLQTQGDGQQCS